MTTGRLPSEHGVIANGFYWRDKHEVEMWTGWNTIIEQRQIWDRLHEHDPSITSAVWFALNSKGCGADFICTPAPIHNPDGSESLWCYTKPELMYGELRDALGHFPLKHFWGPLAGIPSTAWIIASAIWAAERHRPNFFYIYLPHLDYAAQKFGPDSDAATKSLMELDAEIGKLRVGFESAYGSPPLWLIASEYAISPVDHVTYPNRILREAGLIAVQNTDEGELLDLRQSRAFAMVDHQFSHIFIDDADAATLSRVVALFENQPGIAKVLAGEVARRIWPQSRAERRSRPHFRTEQLAGVLLVARRRSRSKLCPHGRHPPQARLRPGRAVLRSGHQEHSARRHARPRFTRCARH